MTPERFQQIDRLVALALERVPRERGAFIKEVCRGDQELRQEVEALLDSHENAGDFLAEPPSDAAAEVVAGHWGKTLPAAHPATRLEDGAALGRYVVQHELGRGGMGTVYAAFDPELNRKVALKLVRPETGKLDTNEGRRRLLREAQAMAQLSHPNVIAVHDVGTFGEQVFIAMEYVEGSTLTKWLAERKRTWREIVNMFVQTGRGLAAAHAAGILHRDFKPDNVLVGKDGRPRVLDFGLARAPFGEPEKGAHSNENDERARADASSPSKLAPLAAALSEPGRLMGTPAYMAPEQLMGQPADQQDRPVQFLRRTVPRALWRAPLQRPEHRRAGSRHESGEGAGGLARPSTCAAAASCPEGIAC
jgi:serine/threonine protein kinase